MLIGLCKPYHLNLSYCEGLTDESVEWLSGSSVGSLDTSGCNVMDQVLFLTDIFLKENTM